MKIKMKFMYQIKIIIITVISVLCAILLFNLCRKIRFVLPWRVNCWFCNHNVWVKLSERNCWTCPRCEQYNGFTRDGDYNKQLFTLTDQAIKTPKVFKRSPPKNGLCKMCNINQQLKVAQLANFVPMNEKNYDSEIEAYRLQIEKAYKLCTPCKRVLQIKLHKEKETLLGSKLLNARTPEKKCHKTDKQNEIIHSVINSLSIIVALVLLLLVSIDFVKVLMSDDSIYSTITNLKEITKNLSERVLSIIKMKMTSYESYYYELTKYYNDKHKLIPKISINFVDFIPEDMDTDMSQEVLGGLACLLQILGQYFSTNKQKYALISDLLLTVFIIICVVSHAMTVTPMVISLIKFSCIALHLSMFRSFEEKTINTSSSKTTSPPRKIKNLMRSKSIADDETETSALDTDDDVSLSKFGLHNFTDSSNETSPNNKSLNSGRMFVPHTHDSIWTKPQMNSTFCVNSMVSDMTKSPSSVSETVFVKPSFNKYQKLVRDDSDSDLDESISSLCIGSPHKAKRKSNSIFSLKKFASPNFVAPRAATISSGRPLISPSALGHSASWVAGGYWGSEAERQIFNINGSRSSSQSSGFESQASSMNQRAAMSQPPSREDSDCGEPDRANLLLDRFQNCNMSNYGGYQSSQVRTPTQLFGRISSPVYPQMQYNGHVHIPQPRLAHSAQPHGFGFTQPQHFVQNSMFKAPASSGIIKLPQASTFASR